MQFMQALDANNFLGNRDLPCAGCGVAVVATFLGSCEAPASLRHGSSRVWPVQPNLFVVNQSATDAYPLRNPHAMKCEPLRHKKTATAQTQNNELAIVACVL